MSMLETTNIIDRACWLHIRETAEAMFIKGNEGNEPVQEHEFDAVEFAHCLASELMLTTPAYVAHDAGLQWLAPVNKENVDWLLIALRATFRCVAQHYSNATYQRCKSDAAEWIALFGLQSRSVQS